jgi:hypothetical protein
MMIIAWTSFFILSFLYCLKMVLNFILQAMAVFENQKSKPKNHTWSVAHISTPIEKENKITWGWKWMDSEWNNKLTSLASLQKTS